MSKDASIEWPDLSEVVYIKGRLATRADMEAGKAAFMLQPDEGQPGGVPIDIEIPQYAIHVNDDTGEETPGVIVQAEEAGQELQAIGFLPLGANEYQVGLLSEFRLMGTYKPDTD